MSRVLIITTIALLALAGCQSAPPEPTKSRSGDHLPPRAIESSSIENFYQLSVRVYSGSMPNHKAGYKMLAERGIKTIISVDGARPLVKVARAYGLRYVHLPVGYHGIDDEQAARIIKAARDLPGPVFIHCHHGLHRGPTAAGLCMMAMEGWSNRQAVAWMQQAGTSKDYAGLYRTAERFITPNQTTIDKVGGEFLEIAEVAPLTKAMTAIDQHWDRVKILRTRGIYNAANNPAIDPRHQALLMLEQFRELHRQLSATGEDAELAIEMGKAERRAAALHEAIRKSSDTQHLEARTKAIQVMSKSCIACHKRFRN